MHRDPSTGRPDLLTLGNSTHTLDARVSLRFSHPGNWALRVADLRPSDAGTYLCQISTFPREMVRSVFLEIRGESVGRPAGADRVARRV